MVVPHPAVRSLFVQKELGERRKNWVTSLQEYDLEFKPTTIIKGQGICKLMAESQNSEEIDWENEAKLHMINMCPIFTALKSWYRDLIHSPTRLFLKTLESKAKKSTTVEINVLSSN